MVSIASDWNNADFEAAGVDIFAAKLSAGLKLVRNWLVLRRGDGV
eukprot:CAMPEP_0119026226 /NCGR_PEP_ID=MMETSP1176-20130426/35087_1 /TAXON_ID=265551 /ORGANISM="Synedropsis recta cf, Strain CCMP1620" /LENGTH=44 /DNA_ID= /DNA_START= /DNA_END= /DNA_ORIENTATION=